VLHADRSRRGRVGADQADWQASAATLDPDSIHEHLVAQAAPMKTLMARGTCRRKGKGVACIRGDLSKGVCRARGARTARGGAHVKDGRVTVWASTQTPFPTRDRIAKVLGLPSARVRVITPFLGGGFGGKSADGQAIEAARLARSAASPCKCLDPCGRILQRAFDPASVVKITSESIPTERSRCGTMPSTRRVSGGLWLAMTSRTPCSDRPAAPRTAQAMLPPLYIPSPSGRGGAGANMNALPSNRKSTSWPPPPARSARVSIAQPDGSRMRGVVQAARMPLAGGRLQHQARGASAWHATSTPAPTCGDGAGPCRSSERPSG